MVAVLHQFDGKKQAEAAHIADGGVLLLQRFELLAHIRLELRRALHQLQPLHLFDGRHGRSQRDRMRLVGVAVREVVVLEVVGDLLGRGAQAQRHIRRSDALGRDEDVGLHVPVIDGKPLAGAAPSRHHFIGNHQHAMAVADLAQAREDTRAAERARRWFPPPARE